MDDAVVTHVDTELRPDGGLIVRVFDWQGAFATSVGPDATEWMLRIINASFEQGYQDVY